MPLAPQPARLVWLQQVSQGLTATFQLLVLLERLKDLLDRALARLAQGISLVHSDHLMPHSAKLAVPAQMNICLMKLANPVRIMLQAQQTRSH
jgi:hypothetical protein